MTDLHSNIATYAAKNDELLGTLRQTDYAESALKQQELYIKDIEGELKELAKNIKAYEQKTKIEKAEFDRYRDSNIKRFAYKLGGTKGKEKFQSRTEKEEREYFEALEKERGAKDRQETLNRALNEAIPNRDQFKRDDDTRTRAQKELDDLYHMIFAGPTPAFPDEDQSEWKYTQAREHFNAVEQKYRAIWQACDIFNQARRHIDTSTRFMDDARSASQFDMLGGGMMADIQERNALSRAESEASQAKSLISQAMRVYPDGVRDLPHFNIEQGNLMSDMFFDNIFTDMAFHDKIKASQQQVLQAQQDVESQFKKLNDDLKSQKQLLDSAQTDLTSARKQLQDMRTQIFLQVGGQQPPPYQG